MNKSALLLLLVIGLLVSIETTNADTAGASALALTRRRSTPTPWTGRWNQRQNVEEMMEELNDDPEYFMDN
uniref:Uncharacterized protein n=1 Tax=Ciona intestinalis TaxID=7719 RepID=F6PWA2_CIOIN